MYALCRFIYGGMAAFWLVPRSSGVPSVDDITLAGTFVLGVATGIVAFPHCVAMCGPLCAGACQGRGGYSGLRYQLGRMVGYAFAGVVAGHLGLLLLEQLPEQVTDGAFGWLSGAVCVVLALRLLPRTSPGGPRIGFRLDGAARKRAVAGPLRAWVRQGGAAVVRILPRDPLLLGALSALLPCGSLYGALLLAAATGTGQRGALLMAGFALAGAPIAVGAHALAGRAMQLQHPIARSALALSLVVTGVLLVMRPASWFHSDSPEAPGEHGEVRCH